MFLEQDRSGTSSNMFSMQAYFSSDPFEDFLWKISLLLCPIEFAVSAAVVNPSAVLVSVLGN